MQYLSVSAPIKASYGVPAENRHDYSTGWTFVSDGERRCDRIEMSSLMSDFKLIEHTADVGIMAWGRDLKEAFVNAARCLFSIMIDANRSSERELRRVVVTATDREALLVEWLNELIYLFDAESLFFTGFDITYLSDILLEANCYGEKVDPTVHGIKTGVKAATYHMLEIKEENGFRAQVLLDI